MKEKLKEEIKESFSGLDNAFGTEFKMPEDKQLVTMKPDDLPIPRQEADPDGLTVEDIDYVETEMKTAIESIDNVMDKMEQDLKIGSPPRMYEAYSQLANAKINGIKELYSFRKGIVETKIKGKQLDIQREANRIKDDNNKEKNKNLKNLPSSKPTIGNLNVIGSPLELLKAIKEASKNSETNRIEIEDVDTDTLPKNL